MIDMIFFSFGENSLDRVGAVIYVVFYFDRRSLYSR